MREIFYEYSASGVPPDPTVNSPKYTGALPYAVGYYKAIAKEVNDWSTVTSNSFGMAPTDYIHYYPLTADFNDHAGSSNLSNSGCTIDGNGCLIDSNSDLMYFTTTLNSSDITIALEYTPSGTNTWRNLLGNNGDKCALFCSENTLGYYNSGFVASSLTMISGTNYKLVVVKSGTNVIIYANTIVVLNRSDCFSNAAYPIVNLGGNIYGQSALGLLKEVKIFDRVLTQDEINSL